MNKTIPNISAILFMFILFVPYPISAHDGEQHLEGGHGLPDSHSESHEEGSGMKSYSKKHLAHQGDDNYKDHEYSSKHSEEGSGTVREGNHADDRRHGSYEKHEEPSERKEEGSGMH